MPVKISEMPPATEVLDAAILPIVQGGVNLTTNRALFLEAFTGETVALSAFDGGGVEVLSTGEINVRSGVAQTLEIKGPTAEGFYLDGTGNVTITSLLVGQVTISAGPSSIIISVLGAISLNDASGAAVFVTYPRPAGPVWAIPTLDLATALDRVAAQVSALLGVPIP